MPVASTRVKCPRQKDASRNGDGASLRSAKHSPHRDCTRILDIEVDTGAPAVVGVVACGHWLVVARNPAQVGNVEWECYYTTECKGSIPENATRKPSQTSDRHRRPEMPHLETRAGGGIFVRGWVGLAAFGGSMGCEWSTTRTLCIVAVKP